MHIRTFVLAGLSLLLLAASACAAIPALPADSVQEPDGSVPEYSPSQPVPSEPDEAVSEPVSHGTPVEITDRKLQFLTAKTFSSNRTVSDLGKAFKTGYADFAIGLLRAADSKHGKLISPLSVLTCLQMAANGAAGQTLDEMQSVLCGLDTEELNQLLYSYMESLTNTEDARLESANALWVTSRPDFHIEESFVRQIENTFRADVVSADLTIPETTDAINDWCSEHTDGMIPKILEDQSLKEDSLMVLLNALCFDAEWSTTYPEYAVSKGVFHGEDGDRAVSMMSSKESYLPGENGKGFLKMYKGGHYAFVGLLPDEGVSLADYLNSLTGESWLSLFDSIRRSADVKLPKFSFDWDCSLKETLHTMGMETVFTKDSDLSGLGWTDDHNAIKIDDVLHKTHIEVDESGTRAAAVTAVIACEVTSIEDRPLLIFDRPFVYAIVDTTSFLPLFIGIATDVG